MALYRCLPPGESCSAEISSKSRKCQQSLTSPVNHLFPLKKKIPKKVPPSGVDSNSQNSQPTRPFAHQDREGHPQMWCLGASTSGHCAVAQVFYHVCVQSNLISIWHPGTINQTLLLALLGLATLAETFEMFAQNRQWLKKLPDFQTVNKTAKLLQNASPTH